ncbi:MAG TPA: VOC family protein [Beijerinckiaceae bacterium]|nr:VOC family protein [Beijerinckiaceae bacterium]
MALHDVRDGGPRERATVAPILPARDFEQTAQFYEALGFAVASLYQPPDAYLIMRRGDVELHFFPHAELDPATSICGCYIRTGEVDVVYEAFARAGLPATGIPRLTPLSERPWGMREFAVIDPNGSLLRIGAPLR